MTFRQRVLAGDLSPEAIQHYINLWVCSDCQSPLHVFLGLVWQEYIMYCHRPKDFYMYMLVQRNL